MCVCAYPAAHFKELYAIGDEIRDAQQEQAAALRQYERDMKNIPPPGQGTSTGARREGKGTRDVD
jgi:hypothetical protein